MQIFIEKLNKDCWKVYKQVRLETLKNSPAAFSSTYEDAIKFSDTHWQELLSDLNNVFFFAKDDSKILGVGRVEFNDPQENPNTAILCGLYIKPGARQHGVANKLIDVRLDECRERENIKLARSYIKSTNTSALNLYLKKGFTIVGLKEDETILELRI